MDEADKFLEKCVTGKVDAYDLVTRYGEMKDEMRRTQKTTGGDPDRIQADYVLISLARIELQIAAITRVFGDLAEIAKAASNR